MYLFCEMQTQIKFFKKFRERERTFWLLRSIIHKIKLESQCICGFKYKLFSQDYFGSRQGLTINDYPHMSTEICTHPGDYSALISGLCLPRRKEPYRGRRRVGSSLVVLGRCWGEIAHKSLTTRTLLQKHRPGARAGPFCYCRQAWFIALTWTMREIFWRVRFVNHGSSAVHTLHAPIERRAPAKYHERREGEVWQMHVCTHTHTHERNSREQDERYRAQNGRYTIESGCASVNQRRNRIRGFCVLSIVRRNTVLILFFFHRSYDTRIYV